MKKPTFLLLLVLSLLFVSCSNDDENIPFDIVSEFNKIPKDELQGWDDGLYSADMYMLASYDEINNHIRYYISDKRNIGLYILLNEERKIIEIGNQNYSANVIHSPEGYLISYVDAEGQLTGLFVKHDAVQIPQNFTRAGSSDLFNLGNLGDMSDFLGNIRDAGTLGADLFNADTYKFLNDLAGIGADGIIGLLPLPLKIPVLSLKEMLEGMTNSLYERQKKTLYGDCNIKIEEISNDGKGNINVFVTIENANTIPSHLYHLYYNEPESVTRNTVYWGVVGKKGSVPYLNWYTKPYNYEALLDCSVSSSQYKMLTFEMPHDGDKWYFRAYLKSLRLKDSNNKVNDNHIKYSEKYEYNALDAYITDFEQTSQYKKEDDITFKCTVEGYINSLADVMEWGIYYLDDKANYTYFPSKYTIGYTPPEGISSQPNTDKIDIEIKIKANSLVDGYKDIKLGVYTKGGYYLSYNGWSEPQIYSLKYSEALCNDEHHVHAVDLGLSVKWACCNVGASSPEEYGGYYAWGETEEKSDYSWDTYKYWTDKDGDGSADAMYDWDEFTEIGIVIEYNHDCVRDISGTRYDVAHVKWGGSWRMPTVWEFEELVKKCTWISVSVNSVDGYKITGPNGNSIFMPSSGHRGLGLPSWGTFCYWSSTSDITDCGYTLIDKVGDGYGNIFEEITFYNNNGKYFGHTVRPVCN